MLRQFSFSLKFLPDMTDLELERAAVAPCRWIKFCGMFQKQNSNEHSEMLHPRTTRTIEDVYRSNFFIVPGGRYLVTADSGLFVWDLGYVSTVDCKLVASTSVELGDDFEVYPRVKYLYLPKSPILVGFPLRSAQPTYCLTPWSVMSATKIGLFSELWITERIIQHIFRRTLLRKRSNPKLKVMSKYLFCSFPKTLKLVSNYLLFTVDIRDQDSYYPLL